MAPPICLKAHAPSTQNLGISSSVSRGSEYQSNSLEGSRPRLDRSQGLRSSESGERQVEKKKRQVVPEIKVVGESNGSQPKIQGQVQRRKGRFSQAVSSKEDHAHTTSGAEETSPGKQVPDLQEEQCRPRRDQSDPEETDSEDQARTTSDIVDSRDKIARSLRRVYEAEDQTLSTPDIVDSPDKVARSLRRV
ncbi:hypothetical protein TNIN_150391 [Trichonephila inaurata madagascariensis]|uniref:Uncharacterized protein n=1 Tax=Trichonephila inaurata madagascariensis TaxID=2747483 RepID=A0A8X7C3Z2_9ARAC|nr:hypothetical protein TNIN_150391 [Trichonephila inaurata madagascariensis]